MILKTKGYSYPTEVIVHAVYLKLRYTLSYRDIEEMLKDRGIMVDHATLLFGTPDHFLESWQMVKSHF